MSLWEKMIMGLGKVLVNVMNKVDPDPSPVTTEPEWMAIARSQLGVLELPGRSHAAAIIAYHSTTTLKGQTDEVPWCSSFVNWVMKKTGIPGTRSAAARSWMQWGKETEPRVGAVVVLSRGSDPGSGHVGFYAGPGTAGKIKLLGGNQGNKVSIQSFSLKQVLAYRWPKEVP